MTEYLYHKPDLSKCKMEWIAKGYGIPHAFYCSEDEIGCLILYPMNLIYLQNTKGRYFRLSPVFTIPLWLDFK
jgi:hypothetical protein